MVEDDPEEAPSEEDQYDPNLLWIPDDETVNFNAVAPVLLHTPITVYQETMSYHTIYSNIKMLSSFISRARVTGDSTESIASKILVKLRGQMASTHKTLQALAGEISINSSGIDPGLYKCLHYHLHIQIYDKYKGNPRHKCIRTECQMYCILPMYARRCFSDTNVQVLFQHLQNIITENGSLLVSTGRTTESKSALNILRHAVSLDHPSLYDSYDVLLAMSGHHGTILNSRAKVDSKLYGLIFDLIRYNDYERHEGRYVTRVIEAMKHTASLPWLNREEYPNFEDEFRNIIQQTTISNIDVSNVPPAVTNSRISRAQVVATNSSTSRAPPALTDFRTSGPPAVTDFSASITLTPAGTDFRPSRVSAVTYSSASRVPPAVTNPSAPPPSYGSAIVIPSSAFCDTDGGLPSYEQVLTDIVEGSE